MKVLVAGGTGTVGSLLVANLLERNAEVNVISRNPQRVKEQNPGATAVTGDLIDPAKMRRLLGEVDCLFLLIRTTPGEAHEGLTTVSIARELGIKRIVYMSVHQTPKTPRYCPHVGAKLLIESVIETSGVPFTFIRPNLFMQNDYWYKESLLSHGSYPQPIGNLGISSCDVRDIAEAAAISLTEPGHEGAAYTIAGPDLITGDLAAQVWGKRLGSRITYSGHSDMDGWESTQISQGMPGWFAYDLKLMYQAWQTNGLRASDAELDKLKKLLGHPPRGYDDFVDETCRQWGR